MQMERLFRNYWEQLTMVARYGCYFGSPFKGYRGFTQADPLTTTIFNMVVNAVIRHWVAVVVGEEAVPGSFGRSVQTITTLTTLFCADDGLLTSQRPAWLQEALDVLTGLFDQGGL